MGRCVNEFRAVDESGWLRKPRRIPERLDLATHLVTGTRTTVEAIE
jgi:hypothetical protein